MNECEKRKTPPEKAFAGHNATMAATADTHPSLAFKEMQGTG
jgi:hypothetical protein